MRRALAAVVAALIAAALIVASVVTNDDGPQGQKGSQPTPTATAAPTVAPPEGDLQATPPEPGEPVTQTPADSELRDETPEDVPKATLDAGKQKTDQLGQGLPEKPQPVGGAQNYSVTQDFSGHVYSDFSSVTPTEFCLHYTVSSNVSGWGDVRAIQSFFKNTRGASATYIADFEGHILQMVPLSNKAWTQGAFNPYCRASVEIIATGRETTAQWLASPLIKNGILSSLARDVMRRYGLPLRFVDPVGCAAPPGYTDHNHIECGNEHTDVAPAFPFSTFKKQITSAPIVRVTSKDKAYCRLIHKYRTEVNAGKKPTAKSTAAFERRLKTIDSRGLKCVSGKVKRK